MRFTTALVAALTLTSIGAQAAPTYDDKSGYKPDVKHDNKPEHGKDNEYELVCKEVAFFHDWDIYNNNLKSVTEGKYIYDCAKDLVEDKNADAIVNYEGHCYPKSLEHVKAHDFFKSKDRDLAIEGSCESLIKENKHKKCYPEHFFDCCYDKKICVKVPKTKDCNKCHNKDDHKDDYKKDDYKKDDHKEEKKY